MTSSLSVGIYEHESIILGHSVLLVGSSCCLFSRLLTQDGNNNAMGSDIVNSHGAVVTNLLIGDEKRAPYMLNGKPGAVTDGPILEGK